MSFNMQELQIKTKIYLDKLNGHKKIKKNILELIEKSDSDTFKYKDVYYNDSIKKLDWNNNHIIDRPWVKVLLPFIQKHFKKCAKKLGFEKCHIKALWFQQYEKNNLHNWHIHAQNYTGVYYLELPKSAPLTELVDPCNIKNKFKIKAKEGDIVIFPSFVIHRSGKMLNDLQKTIVSFNIDFEDINKQTLMKLQ